MIEYKNNNRVFGIGYTTISNKEYHKTNVYFKKEVDAVIVAKELNKRSICKNYSTFSANIEFLDLIRRQAELDKIKMRPVKYIESTDYKLFESADEFFDAKVRGFNS